MLPAGGPFELDPASYAPEARLAELGRAGLDAAVVSLPPTSEPTPDLIDAWHDAAPRLAASSGGRLIPLAYRSVRAGFAGTIWLPSPGAPMSGSTDVPGFTIAA